MGILRIEVLYLEKERICRQTGTLSSTNAKRACLHMESCGSIAMTYEYPYVGLKTGHKIIDDGIDKIEFTRGYRPLDERETLY